MRPTQPPFPPALPIDAFVAGIVAHARTRRAVVVTAAPGAGKTTRVPPALAEDGPVLLLQPRRVAARTIARRIASERGWTIGREVGWHVRFERRFAVDTRLIVATEGMLTARLQQDPLASGFTSIVIDEFHERSIHADLGIAFAKQAWLARADLRLIVMSATIDAARVSRFLNDCPIVEVPGRAHAVDVSYRPGVELEAVVAELVPPTGALLCFLPGAPEIRRAGERLLTRVSQDVRVVPLYGGLDADEQDAAVTEAPGRRVILATNIAETTLTVPDVRVVVDSGLQKVARYDPDRGVDSLDTERIPRDAADQRAGRAGRTGPGAAVRLWDARDRLRPHREPDIARIDLSSTILDVIAWGGDPRTFDWFEAPPASAIDAAIGLLRQIEAVDGRGALTDLGRQLRRLPLHPRLGRLLIAADGAPLAARACAILSERHYVPARGRATTCDLLAAAEDEAALPWHVAQVARDIGRIAEDLLRAAAVRTIDETAFRRAVLAAYPDRVAQRREAGGERVLLASGTGARMARESGVYDAQFMVALDVTSVTATVTGRGAAADQALVRMATSIERDWLRATDVEVAHRLDPSSGVVRATRTSRYGAIALSQESVPVDPATAGEIVAAAYLARAVTDADGRIMRRLEMAGVPASYEAIVRAASAGATSIGDVDLAAHLPAAARQAIERHAPADLLLPSGRRVRLDYRGDGRIVAAAKLQELFGLGDTPVVGVRRVPVTFELLAPNGRPVQVTSDLKSFWRTGYPEVRKALRARYPRHPWPDDPWTAIPTHRPLRRR